MENARAAVAINGHVRVGSIKRQPEPPLIFRRLDGLAVYAAAPSPSAGRPPGLPVAAGKPMYQHDAQHTGRSPYPGPRQARVVRRFDTSLPQNMPPNTATPRADFQSSSAIGPDGTIYIANF